MVCTSVCAPFCSVLFCVDSVPFRSFLVSFCIMRCKLLFSNCVFAITPDYNISLFCRRRRHTFILFIHSLISFIYLIKYFIECGASRALCCRHRAFLFFHFHKNLNAHKFSCLILLCLPHHRRYYYWYYVKSKCARERARVQSLIHCF